MKNLFMQIRCFFKDHEPEKALTETESFIATTRCKYCHSVLIDNGFMWKIKHIPPPNSTPAQIDMWEDFCEGEWHKLRKTVTG